MKQIYALIALLFVVCTSSCQQKKTPFKASGRALEVVTVLPDGYNTTEVKDSLRKLFSGPIGVLPQDEPWCDLLFTPASKFSNVFRIFRNILYIDIDSTQYTRTALHISRNEWANNQLIISARANNLGDFWGMMQKNTKRLGKMFYTEELKRRYEELEGTYSSGMKKLVEDSIGGVTINPIEAIKYTKASRNFVWGSDLNTKGRKDMVVYAFPYTSSQTFTPNYLIAKRDSVLSRHVLGEYLNSYMTTEKRVPPMVSAYTVNGAYCYELRGLWAMEGDMMGGPFVMHAMVDEANHRIIVAEAFVYAPAKEKRNLLMEAEAALFSLRPINRSFASDSVFNNVNVLGQN